MIETPSHLNELDLFYTSELCKANRRVYVYRNLHRNCWSIRQGGVVRTHANFLALRNAKFHVSEAGRQRVIREQRKNVHAGISGILGTRKHYFVKPDYELKEVTYDPYTMDSFRFADTGESVHKADHVLFDTIGKDDLNVFVVYSPKLKG